MPVLLARPEAIAFREPSYAFPKRNGDFANRDSEVFADPFRFDIRPSPNPHLGFGGGGPHFCLGASLARTELQVMIGALLRRVEVIEITGEAIWMSAGPAAAVGVAVQSLPVRLA